MRIRSAIGLFLVGSALVLTPAPARAQMVVPGFSDPYRLNGYLAAPGYYGMAYGSMSVGVPRTYTTFSSPYGPGYGYGYAPYGLLPGRYGVGLWRPGFVTPGYVYGASYYYPTLAGPLGSRGGRAGPAGGAAPARGGYPPRFGPPHALDSPAG